MREKLSLSQVLEGSGDLWSSLAGRRVPRLHAASPCVSTPKYLPSIRTRNIGFGATVMTSRKLGQLYKDLVSKKSHPKALGFGLDV